VAFLRMVFAELLRDEVGNSHTGRQLNVAWRIFLSEIDHEVQQYQIYRAHRTTQMAHGRDSGQPSQLGIVQNWQQAPGDSNGDFWSPETRRRTI